GDDELTLVLRCVEQVGHGQLADVGEALAVAGAGAHLADNRDEDGGEDADDGDDGEQLDQGEGSDAAAGIENDGMAHGETGVVWSRSVWSGRGASPSTAQRYRRARGFRRCRCLTWSGRRARSRRGGWAGRRRGFSSRRAGGRGG